MKPLTTVSGSTPANLDMKNVTVQNCDFRFKTFFMLETHCELKVDNCTMKRNSAYFRGTIATIIGNDSLAKFTK